MGYCCLIFLCCVVAGLLTPILAGKFFSFIQLATYTELVTYIQPNAELFSYSFSNICYIDITQLRAHQKSFCNPYQAGHQKCAFNLLRPVHAKVTSPDGSTTQHQIGVKCLSMAGAMEIRIDLRLERSVKMPVDVVSLQQPIHQYAYSL